MKKETSISSLMYKNHLSSSLLPVFVIQLLLLFIYFSINFYISRQDQVRLIEETTKSIKEITYQEAVNISQQLQAISQQAILLQNDHMAFFNQLRSCYLPHGEPQFAVHANGAFYKTNKTVGGASLYYSSTTRIGAEQLEKARCSEMIDPLLQNIVDANPVIVQAYLNTWDGMNRLYPFMADAPGQYGPALSMEDYNFYYLADAEHDPQRKPVWTNAYLDPAGQGWMVSVVVPVYRGDFLEGVSGLDVTIADFVSNILNLDLPWESGVFMVDDAGKILAMQPRAEGILGLRELTAHRYDENVTTTVEKPDEYNLTAYAGSKDVSFLRQMFSDKTIFAEVSIDNVRYFVSQQIVPETGWRLFSLIERATVLEPVNQLSRFSKLVGYATMGVMILFFAAFFLFLSNRSRRLTAMIATPIERLSSMTQDVRSELDTGTLQPVGIAEIDALNRNFSAMLTTLNARTADLIDAKLSAESANHYKSQFLANMSHELRTPMNAVIGMTHLALQTDSVAQQRKFLEDIEMAGEHLLGVINSILDFSKVEAGKLEIERIAFRLDEIIGRFQSTLDKLIGGKPLTVRVDLADNVPLHLIGDPLRIGQVLLNLGSNAVKFTEEGDILLEIMLLQQSPSHVQLKFSVADTGIGMSEEQQLNIFESFQQADMSTTRKFGGTGLGLSICRRLCELMGGNIGVDSQVGVGTCIWFTAQFEIDANPQRAVEELSKEERNERLKGQLQLFGRKNILVVEDNRMNQVVAKAMLNDIGFEAVLAGDGQEALRLLKQGQFDLILMDMQMPVMDGIATSKIIRANSRYNGIPVIAMTANVLPADREQCLEAGMDDFIGKPIEFSLLLETLLRWLPQANPVQVELRKAELPDHIDGINLEQGLERVAGKQEVYLIILEKFVSGNCDLPEQLCSALENQNTDLAERLVHTVKGSAGIIGANQLRELAAALELGIRKQYPEEELLPLRQNFEESLQTLLAEMRKQLQL